MRTRKTLCLIFLSLFTSMLIAGCAHKEPLETVESGGEIWEMKLKGTFKSTFYFNLWPVKDREGVYLINQNIISTIEDSQYGTGRIFGKFRGEIREGAMECHLDGIADTMSLRLSFAGWMEGEKKGDQGEGDWSMTHEDGAEFGNWVAKKVGMWKSTYKKK